MDRVTISVTSPASAADTGPPTQGCPFISSVVSISLSLKHMGGNEGGKEGGRAAWLLHTRSSHRSKPLVLHLLPLPLTR